MYIASFAQLISNMCEPTDFNKCELKGQITITDGGAYLAYGFILISEHEQVTILRTGSAKNDNT